jgi:hypothetical protein
MSVEAVLAPWLEKAPTLLASILAVLFMAGIAALLGFRKMARLDEAELERLAAAEHLPVEGAVIASDGRSALARLEGGKLLIARVMGADISARVVPAAAARVRRRNGRISVAFADTGFPPLHIKLQEPPSWLAELGEVR